MLFDQKRTSFAGLASLLTALACGGGSSAPTDLNAGRGALTNLAAATVQAAAQKPVGGAQVQDDDDADDVCAVDADCDADELCTTGVCTDLDGEDDDDADDVCAVDADCDADELCTAGVCTDVDGEDDDGEVCEADDGDHNDGDVDKDDDDEDADDVCVADADCDADETCTNGTCEDL